MAEGTNGDVSWDDWAPVPVVAKEQGIPIRTAYTWCNERRVPSRTINGTLHVTRSGLQGAAAARAQQHAGSGPQQGTAAQPVAQAQHPDVELARQRLELQKLHLEEQRVAREMATETRQRLEQDEGLATERARRIAMLDLDLSRRRYELAREAEKAQQDARLTEEAARAAREREERDHARRTAERADENRRREWSLNWERAWANAVRKEFGDIGLAVALPAIRDALGRHRPGCDEDALVASLRDATDIALVELRAERRLREEADERKRLIDDVLFAPCLREGPEVRRSLRDAATRACTTVDPFDWRGRNIVAEAVAIAYAGIKRERAALQAAEAAKQATLAEEERRAQAARAEAEEHVRAAHVAEQVARAWADVRESLVPDLARRWLPTGATAGEHAHLIAELRGLVDRRPDYLEPTGYYDVAKHHVRGLLEDIERRLAVDDELRRRGLRPGLGNYARLHGIAEQAARDAPYAERWQLRNAVQRALNCAMESPAT